MEYSNDKEIDNMTRDKVWTLIPRSETKGPIMTGKWTFTEKSDSILKARWCVRKFSEPFADDTHVQVLPTTSLQMLLAFAA